MTPKDTTHTATQGASGPKCKDGVTLCPYPTDCEIEGRCIDQGASESSEPLGRFGHHPDPAIDFCVEIEAIEAEIADLKAGLEPTMALQDRIDEAICFRVGGDARAVAAKNALRAALAQRQSAPADPQAPSQEAVTIEHLPGTSGDSLEDAMELAVARRPDGYVYRYHDCIRFNDGREVNGSKPLEALPYWLGADPEADRHISATQPASPARELTDAELTAIGAKHLEAHAQFVGAGEVWVEGEVEFARAVIAADRALREQG